MNPSKEALWHTTSSAFCTKSLKVLVFSALTYSCSEPTNTPMSVLSLKLQPVKMIWNLGSRQYASTLSRLREYSIE